MDRPMVNVYEGDPEVLVYRPMNDGEYAQWQLDRAAPAPEAEAAIAEAAPMQSRLADALDALPDGPLTKTDLADVIATLRGTHDA